MCLCFNNCQKKIFLKNIKNNFLLFCFPFLNVAERIAIIYRLYDEWKWNHVRMFNYFFPMMNMND